MTMQAQNAFFSKNNSFGLPLRESTPTHESFYSLDAQKLRSFLDGVGTREDTVELILSLPDANGNLNQYAIFESSIMEPGFQANFPEIKTYAGQGISNPSETIRFSMTPNGFHATILGTEKGSLLIRPIDVSRQLYSVHLHNDLNFEHHSFECQLIETAGLNQNTTGFANQTFNANDGILRNFRIAIAATGEFSAIYNNNLTDIVASIVNAVNTANLVLERDLSVRLTLVDNTSIIFLDPNTDPFSNFDNVALLGENQTLLDTVIGDDNYDIGHVFNTAGGGIAGLNTSCVSGFKAWGVSGDPNPDGDFFKFVFLHELGHQFGSPHTFNGSEGSCGPNISPFTALEPGSGSTIMSYAGLCGSQNIQFPGDLYYHQISLASMFFHIQSSGVCPVDQTLSGNLAPTADAGASYLIPQATPYKLTGSSTDPDGISSHTYTWEQYDFGPAGAPTDTTSAGPLVRSFLGTTNPTRFIPNLPDLLQTPGSQTWERLVTVDRDINYRLTVRDNGVAGGQTAVDAMTATVTTQAGPFVVTSQSIPNQIVWTPGTTETITWNVAGTTANGIDEASVNILLSTDEGLTYDTVLVANTPNDGTEDIIVPDIDATKCRIMVEAVDNIFFNINEAFFAIGNYTYAEVCEDFVFTPSTLIPENATSYNAFPFQINDNLVIDDLNFNVNISGFEDNSALTYAFSPPSGGFFELAVYPCPGTTGIDLTFDDEGDVLDCSDLSSGANVLPADPLSAVDGENAQGNWTFWITDVNENGIMSDINAFTLSICSTGLIPTLSNDEVAFEDFAIYPNPSSGTFNLALSTASSADLVVELFDITGRQVKQLSFDGVNSGVQPIGVNELSGGVYIVKVSQGDRSASKKLIIK